MLKKKFSIFRRLMSMVVILVIGGFIFTFIANITYAIIDRNTPNLIITINKDGKTQYNGSLFGNDSWYPGKSESGVIRIINQYRGMKISNLGLKVDLAESRNSLDTEVVFNSFLNSMRITIKSGRLLVLNNTIVNDKNFIELLYKSDDARYTGYKLADSEQFRVGMNDSIDLKYTLYMDDESGKELENLSATVGFLINVDEKSE